MKLDAEEVKQRLASGYYVLFAPATTAKSEVWENLNYVGL